MNVLKLPKVDKHLINLLGKKIVCGEQRFKDSPRNSLIYLVARYRDVIAFFFLFSNVHKFMMYK